MTRQDRQWVVSDDAGELHTGLVLPADLAQILNDPDTRIRFAWTDIVTGAVVYQDPTLYGMRWPELARAAGAGPTRRPAHPRRVGGLRLRRPETVGPKCLTLRMCL